MGKYNMEISLRDVYVLLECAQHDLRIINPSLRFDKETIAEVVERVINKLDSLKLTVKEGE
jgi:hypothetical protein